MVETTKKQAKTKEKQLEESRSMRKVSRTYDVYITYKAKLIYTHTR